jgi:hypothetical protein
MASMADVDGLKGRLEQNLGKEGLQTRMAAIREQTGGLLDDDAVLALIADEAGMTVQRLSGLGGLSPDAPVSAACTIDEIEPARSFQGDARSGRFRRLKVSEGSTSLTLMLWDDETDIVEQLDIHPGSRIKILSAVLKNTKYGPQIHVGRNGFIVPEQVSEAAGPPVPCDIKDLDGGRVIAKGVLLSFVISGRGKNRCALGRLFDGTGEVDVQFSQNAVEALAGSQVGVEVEISGALVAMESGRRRLVCDEHAVLRIL